MTIDMCSNNLPLITSPRISFSHDLHLMEDAVQMEVDNTCRTDSLLMESNQFDFSFSDYVENEPSSAEELFSDGLIRTKDGDPKPDFLPPCPDSPTSKQVTLSKEIIVSSTSVNEFGQKEQAKSFWRIKRCSSVPCDNSHKKSSFWSLPLLMRSNSTGSVPSSRKMLKDNIRKQNSQKQMKDSSPSSSSQLSQKPPLKKNYGGAYGNGVWISPVLNMPPPYIAKGTATLFGLNSMFRDRKEKKNKKYLY